MAGSVAGRGGELERQGVEADDADLIEGAVPEHAVAQHQQAGMPLRDGRGRRPADRVETAVETTIATGTVTADLAARVDGTHPVGTREFTDAVLARIG